MSKTTLQADDIYQLKWVLDPELSPGGRQLAYILKNVHPNNPEEKYQYQLVLTDTSTPAADGVGQRLLQGFDAVVRKPRWSPDGLQIAFLSNRSGSTQIWVLDLPTGLLDRKTDVPLGVTDLDWSPDGGRIAYAANIADETGEYGEFKPGRYRVIRRLGYKSDGAGYWNVSWPQLFAVRSDQSFATATPSQLTDDRFGATSPRWSPSGTSIAYIAPGEADPDSTSVRNIYVAAVACSSDAATITDTRQLTSDLAVSTLSWSPTGAEISFLADDLSDDRATNSGVWVARVADGAIVNLTADIDRPSGDYVTDDMNNEAGGPPPSWTSDGQTIYSIMSDRGRSLVVAIDFPGDSAFETGVAASYAPVMLADPWGGSQFGATPLISGDHRTFGYSFDRAGTMVVMLSEAACPGDLSLAMVDGVALGSYRALTDVNRQFLASRVLSAPEAISFIGSEDQTIEGWLYTPTNGAQAPYPLILHVHGGPHSAYSMAFNFELQHLAAIGYAVVFVNPHGSHTYGRRINTGTRHDWGGKDYNDLMLAVDHVLERPDIDATRVGVAGGSYGGWMTNYIVTRTNRFKAAIAQRSSSNRISTMLSSMSGYKHQRWEAPGNPWEHLDYFVKISPVFHVANVETPLLLEHSDEDHLCPLMQAEEMFTALKVLGKTVELVYWLGESHYLLRGGKAANRVERLDRVAAWFGRYV